MQTRPSAPAKESSKTARSVSLHFHFVRATIIKKRWTVWQERQKKRIYTMPKLGWQDQLLYWTVMILAAGGSFVSFIFPSYFRRRLSSVNPNAVSWVAGEGSFRCCWLALWLLCCWGIVYTVFYQNRRPVFGRTDSNMARQHTREFIHC